MRKPVTLFELAVILLLIFPVPLTYSGGSPESESPSQPSQTPQLLPENALQRLRDMNMRRFLLPPANRVSIIPLDRIARPSHNWACDATGILNKSEKERIANINIGEHVPSKITESLVLSKGCIRSTPYLNDDDTFAISSRCKTMMHEGDIYSVAISNNGSHALSGGIDGTVRYWDLENERIVRVMTGHGAAVISVAISPDGKRALSGGADRTIRYWNLETGKLIRSMLGHSSHINQVVFAGNGWRAISVGNDGTIRYWSLRTGDTIRKIVVHPHTDEPLTATEAPPPAIYAIDITPDDRVAVSGSSDGMLRYWDMETGEMLRSSTLPSTEKGNAVTSLILSNDGKYTLSGNSDGTIGYWITDSGELVNSFKSHTSDVLSLSFSPDNRFALSGGSDGEAIYWNLTTGAPERILTDEREDGEDWIWSVDISPDGLYALSGGENNALHYWNLATGAMEKEMFGHGDPIVALDISNNGQRSLSASDDGVTRYWDMITGEPIHVLSAKNGENERVYSAVISDDGYWALTGTAEGIARYWDLENARLLRTFRAKRDATDSSSGFYSGIFAPDGKTAYSGSQNGKIYHWDLETGDTRAIIEGHDATVRSLAINPNGKYLVSGDANGTAIVWDIRTRAILHRIAAHNKAIDALSFSKDGRYILSGSEDNTMRFWDLQKPNAVFVMEGHVSPVRLVSFLNDETRALSGANDGTLRYWDIQTGQLIKIFHVDPGWIWSTATTDGNLRLLSGSSIGTISYWDTDEAVERSDSDPVDLLTNYIVDKRHQQLFVPFVPKPEPLEFQDASKSVFENSKQFSERRELLEADFAVQVEVQKNEFSQLVDMRNNYSQDLLANFKLTNLIADAIPSTIGSPVLTPINIDGVPKYDSENSIFSACLSWTNSFSTSPFAGEVSINLPSGIDQDAEQAYNRFTRGDLPFQLLYRLQKNNSLMLEAIHIEWDNEIRSYEARLDGGGVKNATMQQITIDIPEIPEELTAIQSICIDEQCGA